MVPYGPLAVFYGPIYSPMVLYVSIWSCMFQFSPVWSCRVLYSPAWSHMVSYDCVCSCMLPYGPLWSLMVLYGLVLSHMLMFGHMVSHRLKKKVYKWFFKCLRTHISFIYFCICSTHTTSAQILCFFLIFPWKREYIFINLCIYKSIHHWSKYKVWHGYQKI